MADFAPMKSVVVTGATGFIGRHALAPLVDRGYTVHALTAPRQPPLADAQGVIWHTVDLLDPAQLQTLVAAIHPEALLHFAWYVQPGKYWRALENVQWVEASLALMRAFVDHGGRRIVMAGTCAEYDWSQDVMCDEATTPLRPATLYGVSKHALAQLVASYAANAGVSYAWGRIFLPYGPYEAPARFVASVIQALLRNQVAPCSPGDQLRDYMHTEDIGAAFVALLDSPVEGPVNIASGTPITIKDLAYLIAGQIGRPDLLALGALPPPRNEPLILTAAVKRLQNEVNWSPHFDLATGIAQTINWWKKQL